ncbi:A/G-specific adenine glycosylase [Lewinellaceae bacterium SD302]|nr:A/G-specific adenine glycosylase [Lewinellaceae bacterium SD302]
MNWYEPDRRPMPWKAERDPYLIWLSEIILQQTRVEQGLAYFEKFRTAYPTVHDLAAAPDTEVMKHWEGLGYYSRARNLLKAARLVSGEMGGIFPQSSAELLKLPGVGPYTAAAIASFAYDEPIPVLDGNVYRILSRYAGQATPIDTTAGKKLFTALAALAFDPEQPARYNQAIMDFGALVCKPKRADCANCPLSLSCVARAGDLVYDLPVKAKKLQRKTRYFHFLVARDETGRYLVQQRKSADIWRDLFQFPLFEIDHEDVLFDKLWFASTKDIPFQRNSFVLERSYPPRKQQLTHQTIIGYFHEGRIDSGIQLPTGYEWVSAAELGRLAFPKMIASFIADKSVFLDLFTLPPTE